MYAYLRNEGRDFRSPAAGYVTKQAVIGTQQGASCHEDA